MNFKEAAEFFKQMSIKVEASMGEMALAGAEIIEAEAKAELGTYQEGVGPFPEWAQLAQSTQANRSRLGYPPDDPLLMTGQLRDSIHSVLTPIGAVVGTDLLYAPFLENGTSRIPPRPFLSRAAFVKQQEVLQVQKEILKLNFKA